MKPLYTQEEYNNTKSMDKLFCECYYCHNPYQIIKKIITSNLNGSKVNKIKFCSHTCQGKSETKKLTIDCSNCKTKIEKYPFEFRNSKSKNVFCSRSCSATFNNKNKSHGSKRSKLEAYIEQQLLLLYPNLEFHFNQKSAINSELDIYIPSLSLAFELNGIFHYEPIFGSKKLGQIQTNDISKSKACYDTKIDLCIIDTSAQKYVKESTSKKYLDIITNIINERLLTS